MVDVFMFYCKEMTLPLANMLAVRFLCSLSLKKSRDDFFNTDNGKYINVFGNIGTI